MKKRGLVLGALAVACSLTAFVGCESASGGNLSRGREVYYVYGRYNQLAYEMESYRVYSRKYDNGKGEQITREITIPLEGIQYYFCEDKREYITEENDEELTEKKSLTKEIVGEDMANDLGLSGSSNYSSVYKEYLFIEIEYKLIEEKKIEIEEKEGTYVITYYELHKKDKATLKKNEKPYEWIKYSKQYPKENTIIEYRAEIIQP